MTQHRDMRIRILGELDVVRADATIVAPDEWRTGKTMDLLRLLALSNGRSVRLTSLIEKLWPDVTPDKARGSLRTACSRIRRATGAQCIVRQPEGLMLQGAWVDAVQFLDEARRVHVAARESHHSHVLALARAAEQLYRDDFHAYDDESDWARTEREHLAHVRHEMLCDAATSALELGLHRDALDLAAAAVRIDPTSETAHRALMRSHAELGEIGSALRVFEAYRAHLADELGADPSPQTRELHLRLLRGNSA
jgi:DNA-binding SARP family transcriptional activator